ncbi:hypothetical protein IFM89_037922 [Coptis chinensis]|uniref:Cytochrome P450 n=1 Tax=Coptis chinensis TaxID=261450 RepID=A0A835LQ02_9MAGN|nr:hypothetical protein IFM89_037922 [Coptis chinensis]
MVQTHQSYSSDRATRHPFHQQNSEDLWKNVFLLDWNKAYSHHLRSRTDEGSPIRQGMTPAFLTSCIELIEIWKNKTYSQGYCELDTWHDIQDFTADVISRTAFGSNFEEGKKIFELQKEQSILVMQAVQSVYIPGFRFIPTKENKRRMNLDKEIVVNLRDLIRRKTLALESGKSSVDDLLGILLQYSRESSQADMNNLKTTGMPIDQVTMILYEVLRLYPPLVQQIRILARQQSLEISPSQPGSTHPTNTTYSS